MKTRQEIESIARKKKTLRLVLIFLGIFLALVVASVTILAITLSDDGEGTTETTEPPEILEGEALYQNYAIAYPNLNEKDIFSVTVRNSHGTYNLLRDEDIDNNYLMTFYDEDGKPTTLLPPVMIEDVK